MKKILLIILLISMSSCNVTSNESISRDKSKIYMQFADIFQDNTPHYCYFYLEDCASCESIKNSIEEYAMTNNDFYLVIPSNKIVIGYSENKNIGVDNVDDLRINGFPTLLYITEQKVKNSYVGVKEISNQIF